MIWLLLALDLTAAPSLASAPAELRAFASTLQAAAAARDVHAVARLTDREFTTGEELGRADSLAELRGNPALLDKLADLLAHGHCEIEPTHVQCDRFGAQPSQYNHGSIAMLGRTHGRWRLLAFYPSP